MSKPKYLVYDTSSWYDGADECDTLEEALNEFKEKCSKASYSDDPRQEFVMIAQIIKCLSVAEIRGLSDEDIEKLEQENAKWWEDHFIAKKCPACGGMVCYIKPDDLQEGHVLIASCFNHDSILHVTNVGGELVERFITRSFQ